MVTDTFYWRQLDILNPNETRDRKIGIVGAGGIGSPLALLLAKMSFNNITVWDYDKIENHNIPNQLFRISDIGKPKVEALQDIIKDFTDTEINIVNEKWKGELRDILISGVDNMEARKAMYKKAKENPDRCDLLIDARMGAELIRIYAIQPINPLDCEFYEKTLYPPEEAQELSCTAQAIFYNTFTLSGLVGSIVKHFILVEPYPKEIIFDLKTLDFYKT